MPARLLCDSDGMAPRVCSGHNLQRVRDDIEILCTEDPEWNIGTHRGGRGVVCAEILDGYEGDIEVSVKMRTTSTGWQQPAAWPLRTVAAPGGLVSSIMATSEML